jgi:hypothetical protein
LWTHLTCYLALAIVATILMVWRDQSGVATRSDWGSFARGAEYLFSGHGLQVFGQNPIFIGPAGLSFDRAALAIGGVAGSYVLGVLLGLAVIRVVEAVARPSLAVLVVGGVLFLFPWTSMIARGHAEDGLVYFFCVVAVWGIVVHRPIASGVALGLAVASKQSAILLAPLVLAFDAPEDRRESGVASFLVAGLVWLPFLLAEPATFETLSPHSSSAPGSLPRFLGLVGAMPQWWRRIEIAFILASASVLARWRWFAVPLLVFALRSVIDPYVWDYYAAGVLFGAFLLDSFVCRRAPWYSLGALVFVDDVLKYIPTGLHTPIRLAYVGGVLLTLRYASLRRPLGCEQPLSSPSAKIALPPQVDES